MPTPASLVTFTISETMPDCPADFSFFNVLIDPLTMPFSIKGVTLLTVNCSYSMQILCSKTSHDNFSKLFLFL